MIQTLMIQTQTMRMNMKGTKTMPIMMPMPITGIMRTTTSITTCR